MTNAATNERKHGETALVQEPLANSSAVSEVQRGPGWTLAPHFHLNTNRKCLRVLNSVSLAIHIKLASPFIWEPKDLLPLREGQSRQSISRMNCRLDAQQLTYRVFRSIVDSSLFWNMASSVASTSLFLFRRLSNILKHTQLRGRFAAVGREGSTNLKTAGTS